MSALIKIFAGTGKASRYLKFLPEEGVEISPTRDLMGMAIYKKDILEAKSNVSISLGTMSTDSYHALVSINPHLVPHIKNLTMASAWNPKTTGPLYLSFTMIRSIDLSSIGPLVTVYLVD